MAQLLGQATLTTLSGEAAASSRLRKNLNCHADNEARCHRLLNALEPGTYVPPHCHLDPHKEETLVVIKGRFGVLIFDAVGVVQESIVLSPDAEHCIFRGQGRPLCAGCCWRKSPLGAGRR
jgi:cupin fold WbuC family metalloprotein